MMGNSEAREQLEEILSGEEFLPVKNLEKQGIINKLMEKFSRILEDLFPTLNLSPDLYDVSSLAVFAGFFLLLLAGAVWVGLRIIRSRRRLTGTKQVSTITREWEKQLQAASAQGEAGQYRIAVRYAFLALLSFLDEKGWVRKAAWKTNWEYLHELEKSQAMPTLSFARLAQDFDRVWYGNQQVQRAEFDRYLQAIEQQIRSFSDPAGEKGGEKR